MGVKRGRPFTDGVKKDVEIKIRISSEINSRLLVYSEQEGITRVEAIRRGIELLLKVK